MATPAVPGAINISSLTGEEIVQLQSGGQSTAQTTTQDIANLGGGITITDGSHTVDGATQLTVTGGTVGGSTPDATLTISGGGGGVTAPVITTTGTISVPFTYYAIPQGVFRFNGINYSPAGCWLENISDDQQSGIETVNYENVVFTGTSSGNPALIDNNSSLTTIGLGALEIASTGLTIGETGLSALTSIDLSSLKIAGGDEVSSGVSFGNCGSLASVALPAIVAIWGTVDFSTGMSGLTEFSFGPDLIFVFNNVIFSSCALNQASVDGVLASLAALDGSGGTFVYQNRTVDLSGGNAAPSSAGAANAAVLTGRGCTVDHN